MLQVSEQYFSRPSFYIFQITDRLTAESMNVPTKQREVNNSTEKGTTVYLSQGTKTYNGGALIVQHTPRELAKIYHARRRRAKFQVAVLQQSAICKLRSQ